MSISRELRQSAVTAEPLENRRLLSASLSAAFTGQVPSVLMAGGRQQADITLENQGNAPARGSVTVDLYASPTPTPSGGDTLLAQISRPVSIRSAGEKNLAVAFVAPSALAGQDDYLVAEISSAHGITAGTFASATPISFQQPYVNLAAAFVQSPLAATTNGIVSSGQAALINLTNQGNVAARGAVTVNVYLSANNVLDSASVLAGQALAVHVNLAPGASRLVPVRLLVPNGTAPGNFQLFAVATPLHGFVQRNPAEAVAAATESLTVISTVDYNVLMVNYKRHHRRCEYYTGSDYCADQYVENGDNEEVLVGTIVPPLPDSSTLEPLPTPSPTEPTPENPTEPVTEIPPQDGTVGQPTNALTTSPTTGPTTSPTSPTTTTGDDTGADTGGSTDDSGDTTDDSGSDDSGDTTDDSGGSTDDSSDDGSDDSSSDTGDDSAGDDSGNSTDSIHARKPATTVHNHVQPPKQTAAATTSQARAGMVHH